VAASDSTVYSLDALAGVVAIDTAAPFAQKILSPPQPPDEGEPLNPYYLTLAGSTLYGVAPSDCSGADSVVESSVANVVAIDTATGDRTSAADLGCTSPGGIAATPNGTLLIAMPAVDRTPAKIIRIDPAKRSPTIVSQGGALRNPSDIAMTPSGDLVVADRTSGVLRIATQTGKQSTIASGGNLNGVNDVALDASGNIYAIAPGGPGALLSVSVPRRERFSSSGIGITASCRPRCTLGYSAQLGCCRKGKGALDRVGSKRAVRLKLPARINRGIAKRLRKYRTASVYLRPRPGHQREHGPDALTLRHARGSTAIWQRSPQA
jgi:DNA-binding beta-propeller fold protein YncE